MTARLTPQYKRKFRLEVIGEAARHVPPHVTGRYPDVPWDKMRALRNIVAREYFGVKLPIIWETIERRLPPLKAALYKLLDGA